VLTITNEAASAIGRILATREMPDDAGVRITTAAGVSPNGAEGPAMRMELAEAPVDGDEVLPEAPVFLEPETALLLDDKLLDAEVSAEGTQFTLREQA
jgi:iron-sulfur cluster assembly protein